MPRPKIFEKGRMMLGTYVDPDTYEAVVRLAREKGVSVSELLRWWIEEKVKAPRSAASPPANLDPLANGGQRSESERRWELLRKLDEPEVERFPRDVEALARLVEQLEKVPVSQRRTESFLNRLGRARRRLIALKRVARRLLSAGYPLDKESVERLVELERRLDQL
jgi:hypothetical protein